MNTLEFVPIWHRYLDQPKEVSLETFAYCNAACTFCPYPTLERIGQKMPDHLISRLIGEMATWEKEFHFSPFKVNEPFLDKRLGDICRKFEADVPLGTLRLFTNGSALTLTNIKWVAELKRLTHLWISLNEHRPDEYQKLMNIPFERTAKNLDALHKEVEEGRFTHDVMVSRVGNNIEFQHYCHERWPLFGQHMIKKDAWIGFTEPDDGRIPNSPCIRWFELSIMANGVVSLCCMDGTGEYSIGNVSEKSMLEVYNDPAYRERREGLWNRKKVMPCSRCSY